jgi:hypothetical protein
MIRIEQGIFYEICKMVAELKMKGIHMTYEMPPYQIYKEISFVDSAGNWQIIPTGVAVCIMKDSVKVIEETYYIENYREFKQDRTPGFKDMVERLCLKVL